VAAPHNDRFVVVVLNAAKVAHHTILVHTVGVFNTGLVRVLFVRVVVDVAVNVEDITIHFVPSLCTVTVSY